MLCPPRICARDPCAHRKRVTRVRGSSARSTSACDRSPLERWLWAQGIPASAERVFWLHWHEGMKTGDLVLRGADPARRRRVLPRRLDRHAGLPAARPDRVPEAHRPRPGCRQSLPAGDRRDRGSDPARAARRARSAPESRPAPPGDGRAGSVRGARAEGRKRGPARDPRQLGSVHGTERSRATPGALAAHPRHVAGRASAVRRSQSDAPGAYGFRRGFEAVGGGAGQGAPAPLDARGAAESDGVRRPSAPADRGPIGRRAKLSVFELARLRRDVQAATSSAAAPELMRQVVWSIEEGSLKRFSPTHAIHIALKKIREGAWTRPNRMPPNWARAMSAPAQPETCSRA